MPRYVIGASLLTQGARVETIRVNANVRQRRQPSQPRRPQVPQLTGSAQITG